MVITLFSAIQKLRVLQGNEAFTLLHLQLARIY